MKNNNEDKRKLLSSDEINADGIAGDIDTTMMEEELQPEQPLVVSDIRIVASVPTSVFDIGFTSTKTGDIYFNELISKQWYDKKWSKFYYSKFPYELDWKDRPLLLQSQKKLNDYRYYTLSPPTLKKYKIDNHFFENDIIRKILKIQDDARDKRKKLNKLLRQNPYRGIFAKFSDYFSLNDEYVDDNWTSTSEFKLIPSKNDSILFLVKAFIIYMIILPIGCLICTIIQFLIGFIDQTPTSNNKDVDFFNKIASDYPELDQLKIEEGIVQNLVKLATELNEKLVLQNLTINVFAGDCNCILKGNATEREYRRFLLLFQEINNNV